MICAYLKARRGGEASVASLREIVCTTASGWVERPKKRRVCSLPVIKKEDTLPHY